MNRRKFITQSAAFTSLAIATPLNSSVAMNAVGKDRSSNINAPKISIAPTKDHLLLNGKPFFYLADTVWSAFTNPTEAEWEYYLDHRRTQGFNALQINTMPQGDRSKNTWDNPMPFETDKNGQKLFNKPNLLYFQRAEKLVAMAVERGFVPALVVMWAEFIPGTWVNKTYKTQALTREQIKPFVKLLVDTFGKFNPIWLVTGDATLSEEGKDWFKIARDYIKELAPDQLCTFHVSPEAPLPEEWTDIYLTYTGHGIDNMTANYKQAIDRSTRNIKHPVISGEPCYEGHGSGPEYRFNQTDIRKALWWGVLSGAKAGFSYGAHGVWCWHRKGQSFPNEMWAQNPFDWRVALNLPGADDAAFAKKIFELYDLITLNPHQELLSNMPEHVRISSNDDHTLFAIYVAFARDVQIKIDLSRYEVVMINLSNRRYVTPQIKPGNNSTIEMIQANTDVLIIGKRIQG